MATEVDQEKKIANRRGGVSGRKYAYGYHDERVVGRAMEWDTGGPMMRRGRKRELRRRLVVGDTRLLVDGRGDSAEEGEVA